MPTDLPNVEQQKAWTEQRSGSLCRSCRVNDTQGLSLPY